MRVSSATGASGTKQPKPWACMSFLGQQYLCCLHPQGLEFCQRLEWAGKWIHPQSLQERMQPCEHFKLCRCQIRKASKPIGLLWDSEIIISVLLRCYFDHLLQQQQKTNIGVRAWTLIKKLSQNSSKRCGQGNSMEVTDEKCSDSVYILKVEPALIADMVYY